jgi:hypothetical protein
MRSGVSGGLSGGWSMRRVAPVGSGEQEASLRRIGRQLDWNAPAVCINAIAVPAHSATITSADSVSLPVFAVWSQWSNISRMGQANAARSTTVASKRTPARCITGILNPAARSLQVVLSARGIRPPFDKPACGRQARGLAKVEGRPVPSRALHRPTSLRRAIAVYGRGPRSYYVSGAGSKRTLRQPGCAR